MLKLKTMKKYILITLIYVCMSKLVMAQIFDCVTSIYHSTALGSTVTTGIYQAENEIISDITIAPNLDVSYRAGTYAQLQPGFFADATTNNMVFRGEIYGCTVNFTGDPTNNMSQMPTDGVVEHNEEKVGSPEASSTVFSVVDQNAIPPSALSIKNYPNPFTGQTTIVFDLPEDGEVILFVSDMTGKQIARLIDNKPMLKGNHQLVFDGNPYPAGMYYYTIQAGKAIKTGKMVLVK